MQSGECYRHGKNIRRIDNSMTVFYDAILISLFDPIAFLLTLLKFEFSPANDICQWDFKSRALLVVRPNDSFVVAP